MKRTVTLTSFLGFASILFGLFQGGSDGCGNISPGGTPNISVIAGVNPAAPPAPPAEIPASLTIPATVGIDVTKTSTTGGSALVLKDTSGGGKYSDVIAFSANLVDFANIRLKGLLQILHAIKIPVSPDLHKMDALVGIGSKAYVVHLNFEDFDLDGINGPEGCSGSTAPLPTGFVKICVRAWIEDWFQIGTQTRLFAGRFDMYPTDTNPGVGSIRGHDINFGLYQVRADFNHEDPENKITDTYTGLLIDPADTSNPEPVNPELVFSIRALAAQQGPDATADTPHPHTFKTTDGNSEDFSIPSSGQGFGRWLEDEDFWRGSFESGDDPSQNVTDLCAIISSGDAASPPATCEDLGIRITDLAFLPSSVAADVEFFDFPSSAP